MVESQLVYENEEVEFLPVVAECIARMPHVCWLLEYASCQPRLGRR